MVRDYPFEIMVTVNARPNLRDNEMTAMMGFGFLERLFDQECDMRDESVYLEYPERWANLIEQRVLYDKIKHKCPNMKKVEILTHSVYIIQCTPNGSVRIIDNKNEYPGTESIHTRACPLPTSNQGIQVMSLVNLV